ncbi:MAG: glycosyltransferase [Anaeromyxobacteraceae bacterium]
MTTTAGMIESFLLPYAAHFSRLGWKVEALTSEDPSALLQPGRFQAAHDCPWSRDPLDSRNVFEAPRRVREVVGRGEYDLVHVHSPIAAFVTRAALRRLRLAPGGPKVVYTAHGFHFHSAGNPASNAFYLAMEKLAGRWTDRLVLMNEEDMAAARRHRIVPEERLRFMPGIGVDLSIYGGPPASSEQRLASLADTGLPPGAPYVLVVAEFIPRKRHADVVGAMRRLLDRHPDSPLHVLLAGRGPLEPGIRALVAKAGLEQRVHFLGFRRDIPVLLQGASAALLASEQEGLPRCLLEAMAAGTPTIATRIRGVVDLLEGGVGRLVDVGDVEDLAAALEEVTAARGSTGAQVAAARRRVEGYALPNLLRLHEELYEEALRQPGPAALAGAA